MRHCLQCGEQDCRVCEYTADPEPAETCPVCMGDLVEGVCPRCRIDALNERALRFLMKKASAA